MLKHELWNICFIFIIYLKHHEPRRTIHKLTRKHRISRKSRKEGSYLSRVLCPIRRKSSLNEVESQVLYAFWFDLTNFVPPTTSPDLSEHFFNLTRRPPNLLSISHILTFATRNEFWCREKKTYAHWLYSYRRPTNRLDAQITRQGNQTVAFHLLLIPCLYLCDTKKTIFYFDPGNGY